MSNTESSTDYSVGPRNRVKRGHKRATYDRATVHAIIDEAYIAHVGAAMADKPMVQPTLIWRDGETLYIHGGAKNGLFQALAAGAEACLTITLLDGLVFAKAALRHSANYRSVMVFASARVVDDTDEKMHVFKGMIEKVQKDRWENCRHPDAQEIKMTMVLAFQMDEVSAKVRTGGPNDLEEDKGLPHWSGHIPLSLVAGDAIEEG